MVKSNKKLTIDDLSVGMKVKFEQISDIYGAWIYINPKTAHDEYIEVLYFCTDETRDEAKIDAITKKYGKISVIYQPEFYRDDEEVFDD
ncbi:hypothetical protein SAMN04487830_10519 [Pseudobutyrivibrio sp. OR37]|uniref:hypothetical protein n=1 Tax=Pseudobutyrivibrio sp. OR37 TaxID=1798186 RepID=UPI0008E05E12|nr:hypothetical protein [Pseudobutyrivibrio sp. OR37]SFH68365.1 hypothetical protein SAMN04487830_10519 [Pseudobutyrivibrio sp. OR37]